MVATTRLGDVRSVEHYSMVLLEPCGRAFAAALCYCFIGSHGLSMKVPQAFEASSFR